MASTKTIHPTRPGGIAGLGLFPDERQTASGEVLLLEPAESLETIRAIHHEVQVVMLDPWYNKGVGGVREDYTAWLNEVIRCSFEISQHVFVWGFPEIVSKVLDGLPPATELVAWLTWYYKNCPSVVRGWRSAQYTCLHLGRKGAQLYPERFLNEAQLAKREIGKLRYMPGPPNVIEAPLNIGFVGKNEQTGHPAQKPVAVYEPLLLMTTKPGDVVLDPMCGAGTTGEVCRKLGRKAVLADISPEYTEISRQRLSLESLADHSALKKFLKKS